MFIRTEHGVFSNLLQDQCTLHTISGTHRGRV